MPASYAQLLVVSNDKKNLSALGETLRELAHYDVTLTSSLSQAENLAQAQTFDILLMDICLKSEELAQFLDQPGARVAPPVIVTGQIDEIPSLTQCIKDGAADYLLLPTNPTLLEARIRPHLQKKRLQEQALTSLHAFNEVEKLADDLRLVILPLGIALSAEKNWNRLLERFVVTAMDLCHADAGSLFMRTEEDTLRYEVMRVKSLDVAYGGISGEAMPYASLPLYNKQGQPDLENVATFATHEGLSINIANIYDKSAFDFSGTHRFDKKNNYRTISCLTVPLQNNNVIGVLQLRNAKDPETGQVISFGAYQQLVAESLASQAAVAVHNRRLRQRETSLLRYKRELQIGRGIQASFFPDTLPQPPGWELAARFHAAREVAGDFYDAFALPHNKIGLVIADVCDKGVVAALFMALLRSLLRSTIQQHYYLTAHYGQLAAGAEEGAQPALNLPKGPFSPIDSTALLDSVRLINGYIGSNHASTHIFATLFFGILDPMSGKMLYVNCGHIPPLLRTADGRETNLMPTGPAVGLLPDAQYSVQEAQMEPGDTLLAYTDGVTEARNPNGNLFGDKRLLSLSGDRPYPSAAALLDAIDTAVKAHTAGADPSDDVTMLATAQREMSESIIIDSRYNGPPNSGNGGYVCGLLANAVEGSAEVTLRKPPPLARPLLIERTPDSRVLLKDGMDIIAEARPLTFELELPQAPNFAAASLSSTNYIGFQEHYFPDCFVCGPARDQNDGLRIFPGPLPDNKMVAAPWVPDDSLANESGFVRPEFLWAALDCPGYFAITGEELSMALLGRMTAEIIQPVQPNSQNIVLGWKIGREGRKRYAGTAVFTPSGTLCAKAIATWIELAPK